MIELIVALAISFTLIGGIFLLCDDHKEILQGLRQILKTERKLIALVALPIFIFYGFPLYLRIGVWGIAEHSWSPYIFCGMPAAATTAGTGYPWFNLMYVAVDIITLSFVYNPIGLIIFCISLWWLNNHPSKAAYLLMIFLECAMLYLTYLVFGLRHGYLT